MISLEKAFGLISSNIPKIQISTEQLPVEKALGRILSENVFSSIDMPSFDRSAMDGYAVCENNDEQIYHVIEIVPAGTTPTKELSSGIASKIMTGAPLPKNTIKIIPVENTSSTGNFMKITKPSTASHICLKGENIKSGELICRNGTKINSLVLANLIACGITDINVFREIDVAIISTGNEVKNKVEDLGECCIMDSNMPMLKALCIEHSLNVIKTYHITDNQQETISTISEAFSFSDIIILTGGVSAGDFDFVRNALDHLNIPIHFSKLAVKPGRPTVFASDKKHIVFGLPGNPVSVFLMFHLCVLKAVNALYGKDLHYKTFPMRLAEDYIPAQISRTEYVPCVINQDGFLETFPYHGSGDLRALLAADGFFIVPPRIECLKKEDAVSFISIRAELC